MCGIAGYFSSERPISREKLSDSLHSLRHRGPDGSGYWQTPDGKIALAHARLSIIDLSTGSQPLLSQDKTLICVVNGEFYGFQAIREDLEAKGHRFSTKSDSEILIYLYREYGERCLEFLRGEFAFLLFDVRKNLMLAGRDRFGIKPLFYSKLGTDYYFGSEVKALFQLGVPAKWDLESLFQATHFMGVCFQDRTYFQGVRQVPPGHYLKITRESSELVKYWDFNYPSAADLSNSLTSERDYIQGFREVLNEAIKLRMHADVPVASYLSGGLDSGAILGIASQFSSKPVKAFTLGFDRPEYDEGEFAREMAKKANADFHLIPMRAAEMGNHFASAVEHSETLMHNAHGVAKFLLSRGVRDAGYKVVLTGEGSDEIMGGYPHFRRDMLLHNTKEQDPVLVEQALAQLRESNKISVGLLLTDGPIPEIKEISEKLGFVPGWIQNFVSARGIWNNLLPDGTGFGQNQKSPYEAFLAGLPVASQLNGRDPLNQSLYSWSKMILPNYLLSVLGDRMEMAHSVEGRVPFLDHKVVEYVTRVPVSLKIKGMTEKYLLREAAKDVLADVIYRRQKHPFYAPPITTNPDNALHGLLHDSLRSDSLDLPFIDKRKLRDCLDGLATATPAHHAVMDPVLTGILSATILQKTFSVGN